MEKKNTRKLAVTAMLAAICLILGLTPVGYIPIPPVEITLMCIPVIVGTMMEGLRVGLLLGFTFGLTSFLQIFIKPMPFSTLLFSLSPLKTIVLVFIPRLLIPVTTWYTYKWISGKKPGTLRQAVSTGIGALIGSLTNTVFFLGVLYFIFQAEVDVLADAFGTTADGLAAAIASVGAINGLPEAAVAVVFCTPIVVALKKMYANKKEIGA